MLKLLRVPTLLLWLTCLWVALWGKITLGNVAAGFLVAISVVAVARPTGVNGLQRTYFRPVSAAIYVTYFLGQLVKSSLIVAWEIITPGVQINRAIIGVPMHTSSPGVVTLVANSVTLTPGTVTVEVAEHRVEAEADGAAPDVDPSANGVRRTLFIHVLHFIDVESVRRDVLQLERLAIKAFGSRDELPLVEAELAELAQPASSGAGSSKRGAS